MGAVRIDGLDDLIRGIGEIYTVPDDAIDKMVQAGGEVLRKSEEQTAKTMLQGPYNQGAVAAGLKLGKTRKTKDGASALVTFQGKQHGNRIAEIAFVNEFGKTNQAPRPFIRTAVAKSEDQAVEAAAAIYDDFIKSKNL